MGHLGIEEFVEESGFARPGLSDDRDHLAVPSLGAVERLAKRIHLSMAGDEPGESSPRGSLKTRPRRFGRDQLQHIHGFGEALDRHEP